MLLAISFLIYLAKYLFAISETKFCEAKMLLIIDFRIPVHVLPPASNVFDANAVC
jgi:hypothetical protein